MAKIVVILSLLLGSVLLLAACNPNLGQPTAKPAATTPPATATTKPAPTATKAPAALPTPSGERPIVVGEPKPQQNVKSPVRISGLASVFEGTVQAEVVDSKGNIVGRGFTTASAGGPEVGTFSFDLTFTPPANEEPGAVRVFSMSPRDGSRLGLVEVPVVLSR